MNWIHNINSIFSFFDRLYKIFMSYDHKEAVYELQQ